MKKRRFITILILIILWQSMALLVDREILIPLPSHVFTQMFNDLSDPSFYYTVFTTLFRVIKGLALAVSIALIMGVTGGLYPKVADYFSVINDIIKSIPNISYIIIILIWLGSESSVIIVSFFILFPTFYANVLLAMNSLSKDLQDVMKVYPESSYHKLIKVYLPQIYPYLLSALRVGFGLGFKVSVMAEILTQVQIGVGKQLSFDRNMLDMTGIFAWTIWIIIISLLVENIFSWSLKTSKIEDQKKSQ